MRHFKPAFYIGLFILCVLLVGSFGCSQEQTEPNQPSEVERIQVENRDDLLGWYQMANHTLIPVLKHGSDYYSVSRGFEIPLKPCAEGLVWELTQSSMNGTIIGHYAESNAYYISIIDRQRANFEESYVPGKKQAMVKVHKPSGLLDAMAPTPEKNDDFLGWYTPLWFPWIKFEIQKDRRSYYVTTHEARKDNRWATMPPQELIELTDGLGFRMDRVSESVIYNKSLQRFEMIIQSSVVLRMPLVSIAANEGNLSKSVRIGIPTWH